MNHQGDVLLETRDNIESQGIQDIDLSGGISMRTNLADVLVTVFRFGNLETDEALTFPDFVLSEKINLYHV